MEIPNSVILKQIQTGSFAKDLKEHEPENHPQYYDGDAGLAIGLSWLLT